MTTTSLARFNRNVQILFRYSCGDTVQGIADSVGIHRNQVHRIVRKPSIKLVQAVAAKVKRLERVDQLTL